MSWKCCMLFLLPGVLSHTGRWNNLVNVSLFFSFLLFWYTKNTFKTLGNLVPSDYIRAAQCLIAEQRDTFLFSTLTILEFDAQSISQKS